MALERFAASWREAYVSSPQAAANGRSDGECVFCRFAALPVSLDSGVVWQGDDAFLLLNAFPYGSGHLLCLPKRHVARFDELSEREYVALALAQRRMVQAIAIAYGADGMNIGANIGRAAGAGIPKHLHIHALPRWEGDTNFITTIGETRVLPESLALTWEKVTNALQTLAPDAGQ